MIISAQLIQKITTIFSSHDSKNIKDYKLQQLIDYEEDETVKAAIQSVWDKMQNPKTKPAEAIWDKMQNPKPAEAVWDHADLQKDKKGNIMTHNPTNLYLILTEHPKFKNRLTFNQLTHNPCYDGKEIHDLDYTKLRTDICSELKLTFSKADVIDTADLVANQNTFHPIKQYLESMQWDRKDRINDFLVAMQIDNNTLNKECITKWLIACVARIMKPGCKVDSIPVIQGLTGNRKSSALKALMAQEEWFTDEKIDFDTKDALQILLGKWIVELAELSSFNRRDNNQIKSNITRTVDEFRSPYDRKPKKYPRQFCYVGTTNDLEFLTDPTSNRRFWVFVNEGEIDTDAIILMRDQLWAQAVALFVAGEKWWLSRETENQMAEVAEQFETKDAWHDAVAAFVKHKEFVTTSEVLKHIKIAEYQFTNIDRARIVKILQFLHWKNGNQRINGEQTCGWKNPEKSVNGIPIVQISENWN